MSAAPPRLELAEAVDRFAPDGSTVYIGNFGAQLFAVGHELIRQHRRSIHAVFGSGGILMDQLLGARVLAEATFGHCWSPVGPAPAWNFRRQCEAGAAPQLNEVTLGMLASALRGAAWDVPFMPVMPLTGTVYEARCGGPAELANVGSPFGRATVVRSLAPDVAFVHVHAVDEHGNGILDDPRSESSLAAQAAREVVLVAEGLIDAAEVRASAAACVVPGFTVSAVVVEPFAVHPDGASNRYERDLEFYSNYVTAAATQEGFEAWLHEWVSGLASRKAYTARLQEITRVPE